MTLINAIDKCRELEKDNKSQYVIISDLCNNVVFICPMYNVINNRLVITGFFDANLCFHNVDKKMFNINDWRVVEVRKTILNDISDYHNIITINNKYYEFSII